MATNGSGGDEPMTEKINIDIVTLTRFLTEEQSKHKEATGDFTYSFQSLYLSNDLLTNTLSPPDSSATPSNSPSNQSPTTSAAPPSST